MKWIFNLLVIIPIWISCSDSPVEPPSYLNEFNISNEAKNFPWELVTGKIAYDRSQVGVILVDCENRKMKVLKILPYLDMMTWYYSGNKITGIDLGSWSPWSEYHRSPEFYCIDLEGKNSNCEYAPFYLHSWSNEGNLAYIQSNFSVSAVFINRQSFISSSEYPIYQTRPAWSPDSKDLVISLASGIYDTTYSTLMKFNVSSKLGIPLLTADSIGYNYIFEDPIYSPDGQRIAYVYLIKNFDQSKHYMKEIWVVNSSGTDNRKLTTGYVDSFPAWSPEGQKLIFQRNTIENPKGHSEGIFIINVDGSGLQKILSNRSDMPIWM